MMLEIFGSMIVTLVDPVTVEKFGVKSDVKVCGVMLSSVPSVMT